MQLRENPKSLHCHDVNLHKKKHRTISFIILEVFHCCSIFYRYSTVNLKYAFAEHELHDWMTWWNNPENRSLFLLEAALFPPIGKQFASWSRVQTVLPWLLARSPDSPCRLSPQRTETLRRCGTPAGWWISSSFLLQCSQRTVSVH